MASATEGRVQMAGWTVPPWRWRALRTLQGRLAFGYASVALVAVLVSAASTTQALRSVIFDRVAADLADESRVMAIMLAEPLGQGDLDEARALLARVDVTTSARVLVVDVAGNRLSTVTPPPSEVQAAGSDLSDALQGRRPFANPRREGRGDEVLVVEQPVLDPNGALVGGLRASYNVEDIQETLTRLNAIAFIGAVLAALLAAAAGLVLASSIASPVRRVARAARELANGQRPERALTSSRGGTDEVRSLVSAFNSLASQLQVHEQARQGFASDVSHELHSLASAMQTAAEALERGAAEENPALSRRLVAGLVGHTRRLNRLADDLLELARFEGSTLDVEADDIDLGDVVQGVLDEWTAEAERQAMRLDIHLPRAPMPIRGDPVRLSQALGNLVENALKYAGAGGRVQVRVRAPASSRRSARASNRMYEVAVEDTGPGIPPDVLPRIFERYFRVEGRAAGGPGGMGLGLAIAREIARAHGGDLIAESEPGHGARFTLQLPAAPGVPRVGADQAKSETALTAGR